MCERLRLLPVPDDAARQVQANGLRQLAAVPGGVEPCRLRGAMRGDERMRRVRLQHGLGRPRLPALRRIPCLLGRWQRLPRHHLLPAADLPAPALSAAVATAAFSAAAHAVSTFIFILHDV